LAGSSQGEVRDSARLTVRKRRRASGPFSGFYCSPALWVSIVEARLSGCRCSENFRSRGVTWWGREMVRRVPESRRATSESRAIQEQYEREHVYEIVTSRRCDLRGGAAPEVILKIASGTRRVRPPLGRTRPPFTCQYKVLCLAEENLS
jgi:hypothetical protein